MTGDDRLLTKDLEISDPRVWVHELAEAGWTQIHMTLWQAPCGHYFRGPALAWKEMRGTHLADCIAAGTNASHSRDNVAFRLPGDDL